jgi:ABC-type multidrug transport system ATPase subunit
MNIILDGTGKRFNNDWVFRNLSFTIESGSVTAVLGRNGSGKSTLLQVIAGHLHPSEGNVTWRLGNVDISADTLFHHLAMTAPYLELIEDFTLAEMITFHFSFKKLLPGVGRESIGLITGLQGVENKQIRQYSSGMKQRVKLVLTFLSDVPLLLLDEPTMNLDDAGIAWYRTLIDRFRGDRTIIICTNQHQTESSFAGTILQIGDFKPGRNGAQG